MNPNLTVIFSDVHLSPHEPRKTERLCDFLEAARTAKPARLYCLGDLFHYWIGHGHERAPAVASILRGLHAVRATGTELLFVHGNRDFLVDETLSAAVGGMRIVRDHLRVRVGSVRLHIGHGDLLCARDTRYRAMRRVLRSALLQRLFAALPLGWRMRVGSGMRDMSKREVQAKIRKGGRVLRLGPSAVRRMLNGADLAVIGHVHDAKAIEAHASSQRRGQLVCLGAWDDGNASWVEIEGNNVRLTDGPGGRNCLQFTV